RAESNDATVDKTLNIAGAINVLDPTKVASPYIDVAFKPSTGKQLNIAKITDTTPEFDLQGEGAMNLGIMDTPTQITGTTIFRYYLSGTFSEGPVKVVFLAGSWEDDLTSNLAETESVTVCAPKPSILDPLHGESMHITNSNVAV